MSIPWLKELEEKVQATTSHLRDLREENASLKERVTELESTAEAAPDAGEREAWAEERGEIRRRVEELVEHLESLLAE